LRICWLASPVRMHMVWWTLDVPWGVKNFDLFHLRTKISSKMHGCECIREQTPSITPTSSSTKHSPAPDWLCPCWLS
jgi:hypothetical protein